MWGNGAGIGVRTIQVIQLTMSVRRKAGTGLFEAVAGNLLLTPAGLLPEELPGQVRTGLTSASAL